MDDKSQQIIADARAAFDYYLSATSAFVRYKSLPGDIFLYPEETIQTDIAAFAGIFTCIWGSLKEKLTFKTYYAGKPTAFDNLARIVTPNIDDPHGFTSYARFWENNMIASVANERGMHSLCRTLRNGFAHFYFRYIDVTPHEYFSRIGLALPLSIPEPDTRRRYRIFICDWKTNYSFLDPASDTRIIETHFAHFRYHLFIFLAHFFSDTGHEPYKDILTQRLII